jgi:crotonobetainyl-CoA:carnitine CoA-transferase CaiB-like acyl-CoA transferase
MRLQEIFTDEEWQRLEQLIYATAYKALTAYQQQRATTARVQQIATKPTATLKPQTTKKAKALARKAKRAPYAAPPKALSKPVLQTRSQASTPQAYRPVKTAKPLPPTTRKAVTNSQPSPKPTAPSTLMNLGDVDQATRQWLPADKRGQNPTDLLSLAERG